MGETLPILSIDQDSIPVHPNAAHEWLLPTADVARGYGVQACVIRKAKERHADELAEGVHWVVTVSHTLGGQQDAIQWTKLGVITLGFFLRSERAKHFRAAAAKLVLSTIAPPTAAASELPPSAGESARGYLRDRNPMSDRKRIIHLEHRQAHMELLVHELACMFGDAIKGTR